MHTPHQIISSKSTSLWLGVITAWPDDQLKKGDKLTDNLVTGKRVLLIASTQEHANQMKTLLQNDGVQPCLASSVRSAITQMMIQTFDVVALDAGIENASHLVELLLDLRHAKNTLLLLFPIRSSVGRANYLNRGFDMCLPDSAPKECSAAVCALLRRPSVDEYPSTATPPGRIIHKELILDPLRQKVLMAGHEVTLTALEFKLLYFLASNPSIVFPKELIYERVWRENSLYGSKSVSDMICSIRQKLRLSCKDTNYIKTVKGIGYCFSP